MANGKAVPSANAENAVRFIYEEIFCTFGPPKAWISDNRTHLDNKLFETFSELITTKHRYAALYFP